MKFNRRACYYTVTELFVQADHSAGLPTGSFHCQIRVNLAVKLSIGSKIFPLAVDIEFGIIYLNLALLRNETATTK